MTGVSWRLRLTGDADWELEGPGSSLKLPGQRCCVTLDKLCDTLWVPASSPPQWEVCGFHCFCRDSAQGLSRG